MFKILIVIIFLVVSGLLKAWQNNEQQQRQRPQQPRGNMPPRPQPGGQPQAPADRLETEIEEFLRRASQTGQPRPSATPRPTPQPKLEPLMVTEADVIEADVVDIPWHDSSVAEHVRQHISSDPVGGNANRLGSSVAHEIDDIESHVHQVFDHQLGQLRKTATDRPRDHNDIDDRGTDSSVWEGSSGRQARALAVRRQRVDDIRHMLLERQSLQKAIILGEVLKRPDF